MSLDCTKVFFNFPSSNSDGGFHARVCARAGDAMCALSLCPIPLFHCVSIFYEIKKMCVPRRS